MVSSTVRAQDRSRHLDAERTKPLLFLIFVLILGSVMVAPFTLPAGSVDDLSGTVGTVDNTERIEQMNPFAGAVYYVGDVYCDQSSGHSYYLNGNQMPVSSRVVGIFGGLFAGMAIALLFRPKLPLLVLLGVVPTVADWTLQLTTSYESLNWLRALTGLIAGMSISLFVSSIIDRREDKAP